VPSLIPGNRLRYLTCNPFGRGICGDVDPDEVSAVEPDNDEGIEQVAANAVMPKRISTAPPRIVAFKRSPRERASWMIGALHVLITCEITARPSSRPESFQAHS
jgi:hypothetical protein